MDCHSNYVLAVDAAGSFAVFWIDYQDQENDEDTLKTCSVGLNGEEPIAMYTYPAEKAPPRKPQRSNEVVVVTSRGIHHFDFGFEDDNLFLRPTRMVPIPSQNLSNVYSCELKHKMIYISNLPHNYADFSQDPRIHVYNADI